MRLRQLCNRATRSRDRLRVRPSIKLKRHWENAGRFGGMMARRTSTGAWCETRRTLPGSTVWRTSQINSPERLGAPSLCDSHRDPMVAYFLANNIHCIRKLRSSGFGVECTVCPTPTSRASILLPSFCASRTFAPYPSLSWRKPRRCVHGGEPCNGRCDPCSAPEFLR